MDDYYNPKNNFLNYVIEKKIGIPITISIIYSEIAKYIDLDIKIVGFPSHVIVKHGENLILDPFHSGKILSLDNLQEILYNSYGDAAKFLPEYLNEITTEQILIRMLRNLKNSYTESYSYEMAIRCNKMILSIIPESPEEIRDMGIIEERMLHYEKAITLLNHYLELEPNADDVDFVLELIKATREKIIH
jgi:regulator of sirC expression with transglutaminase-like and TPR domain